MTIRAQLLILALLIILLLVVLLFPRQAGADVPVVASAVPAADFRTLTPMTLRPAPSVTTPELQAPSPFGGSVAPSARPVPKAAPVPTGGPKAVPAASVTGISAARAFALRQLGAVQFACLDELVERESRWNPLALNRESGAYGLPQAVPGSKMATAGSDWRTNPTTQLRWMLGYCAARYGTPCRALHHALTEGWY